MLTTWKTAFFILHFALIGAFANVPSLHHNATVFQEVEEPSVNFDCGIKGLDDRVKVGDHNAAVNEWPWMAVFGKRSRLNVNQTIFVCNGVLINDQYVLSTAYGLFNHRQQFVTFHLGIQHFGPLFVRLGEHSLESIQDGANSIDVPIGEILYNPQFRTNQRYHNLALVKLAHKIQIMPDVSPICLPWGTTTFTDMTGRQGVLSGWGWDNLLFQHTSTLQETEIEVVDLAVCRKSFLSDSEFKVYLPEGIDERNHLCTVTEDADSFFCPASGGASFMYHDLEKKKWVLGGIYIGGAGCGVNQSPAICTSVKNLQTLRWIADVAFT